MFIPRNPSLLILLILASPVVVLPVQSVDTVNASGAWVVKGMNAPATVTTVSYFPPPIGEMRTTHVEDFAIHQICGGWIQQRLDGTLWTSPVRVTAGGTQFSQDFSGEVSSGNIRFRVVDQDISETSVINTTSDYAGTINGSQIKGTVTTELNMTIHAPFRMVTSGKGTGSFEGTISNAVTLVLVTHGWKPGVETWEAIRAIRNRMAAEFKDWSAQFGELPIPVKSLDWKENDSVLNHGDSLATGFEFAVLDWRTNANTLLPKLHSARRVGTKLGNMIAKEKCYAGVHLIGHSLGCWLIDTVADHLQGRPTSMGQSPYIGITFLDAYAHSSNYGCLGSTANWAEHYFAKEEPLLEDIWRLLRLKLGTPCTDWTLPNAYNIDISDLMTDMDQHSRPVFWYRDTVANPKNPPPISHGWGFQKSGWCGTELPSFAKYPRGRTVRLGNTQQETDFKPFTREQEQVIPLDGPQVTTSDTGTVTKVPPWTELTTGSPVWLSMPFSVSSNVGFVRFDYQFLSGTQGILTVELDGETVFEVLEAEQAGLKATGWFLMDPLSETNTHHVRFILDPAGGPQSRVQLSPLTAVVVESPSVSAVLSLRMVAGNANLHWPKWYSNVVLQSSARLPGAWSNVTVEPQIDGDALRVTKPKTSQSEFFRLVSP
jgi:hypothetical protein